MHKKMMDKRNMKRTISALYLLLLTCVMTTLCSAGDHGYKTVVDQVGRTLRVPVNPQRVVSLAPSITEIVCAIGRKECLKGVTVFSDYPEEITHLPKVGSYIRLDLERIISLKPDICFAVKDGNPKETVDRIEQLGVPVYAVNPVGLTSVMEAMTEIGTILNASEEALAVSTEMQLRINHVKTFSSGVKNRPGVFFQIGIAPIVAVGTGTFLHELIELAGGVNLTAGPTAYPRYSKEQVLALNPDIIIITSMARGEIFESVQKEWNSWPHMSAVKKNRVHIVDSDTLDRPTPRMVDGLESLTGMIYPEFTPLKRKNGTETEI